MIAETCDRVAGETGFCGVVRIDRSGEVIERAYGLADRRFGVPFNIDTRAGIASGTKGFTALGAMALVETGDLSLATKARSLLGPDLGSIDDAVTVEHLLAHRSGIGDYLDESAQTEVADYVMPVPVHMLDSTEAYVAVIDGHPQVSRPGSAFAYNNGGYVVLALLIERATGKRFEQVVDELVCQPAALGQTGFLRTDSLPPGVATGYLEADGLLTNALHLPVLGSGDGGLYSTATDLRRFWQALLDSRIVSAESVGLMTRQHSVDGDTRYGLGFWLDPAGRWLKLEGYDAGVSFTSGHDPVDGATCTVIANTSPGAWPLTKALIPLL